jgi:hypothetical protein
MASCREPANGCFSKATQIHALVIGLFVNHYAFGRQCKSGHLHIENITPILQ